MNREKFGEFLPSSTGFCSCYFVGGFLLAVTNEAVTFFRARKNTNGTIVHGYALYEKNLPGRVGELWILIDTSSSVNLSGGENRQLGK